MAEGFGRDFFYRRTRSLLEIILSFVWMFEPFLPKKNSRLGFDELFRNIFYIFFAKIFSFRSTTLSRNKRAFSKLIFQGVRQFRDVSLRLARCNVGTASVQWSSQPQSTNVPPFQFSLSSRCLHSLIIEFTRNSPASLSELAGDLIRKLYRRLSSGSSWNKRAT